MISWELAERIALQVAGGESGGALPGDLTALGDQAEAAVVAYSHLRPSGALPVPEAVGRDEWARANLALLRETIAPVEDKLDAGIDRMPGALQSVVSGAIGAEVGGLLGYMGRRVLGQYEVAMTPGELPRPPRLLLVTTNLVGAAEKLEAPLADVVAWVMVHEITHAVQFGSVPWLRPYLGGLVGDLLGSADVSVDASNVRVPGLDELRAIWGRAREGGLVTAVAGPERREQLDQIQAAMALVEGHAEHVMDAAGIGLVPDLDRLRTAMDRRRTERSPIAAVIEKLLGLELKLRQYQDGKRFVDGVVDRAGIDALNRAFVAPELLPTAAEIQDPAAWLRRSAVRQLGR